MIQIKNRTRKTTYTKQCKVALINILLRMWIPETRFNTRHKFLQMASGRAEGCQKWEVWTSRRPNRPFREDSHWGPHPLREWAGVRCSSRSRESEGHRRSLEAGRKPSYRFAATCRSEVCFACKVAGRSDGNKNGLHWQNLWLVLHLSRIISKSPDVYTDHVPSARICMAAHSAFGPYHFLHVCDAIADHVRASHQKNISIFTYSFTP